MFNISFFNAAHFFVMLSENQNIASLLDFLIDFRIFFFLNGVVYVDRKDKESKRRGSEKMLQILQRGKDFRG